MNPEFIGTVAAVFTTAAYIPQTIKVLREKHTKSISLGMYVMISLGIAMWLVYGLMIQSPSLIIANGLTLAMSCMILFMKIKYG